MELTIQGCDTLTTAISDCHEVKIRPLLAKHFNASYEQSQLIGDAIISAERSLRWEESLSRMWHHFLSGVWAGLYCPEWSFFFFNVVFLTMFALRMNRFQVVGNVNEEHVRFVSSCNLYNMPNYQTWYICLRWSFCHFLPICILGTGVI